MLDVLDQLYTNMVCQNDEVKNDPQYQESLVRWKSSLLGDSIDQEDGARLREIQWGRFAFRAGLRFAFALSVELIDPTPEF